MNNKKIKKGSQILKLSNSNLDTFKNRFKKGIIYTIYSVKFNSLKVGFAENDIALQAKLSSNEFILTC